MFHPLADIQTKQKWREKKCNASTDFIPSLFFRKALVSLSRHLMVKERAASKLQGHKLKIDNSSKKN